MLSDLSILALIVLIPLGLKMSDISEAFYGLAGIKDFDKAKRRWRWAAYLAVILVRGIFSLFALYSMSEGFKRMINQMTQ